MLDLSIFGGGRIGLDFFFCASSLFFFWNWMLCVDWVVWCLYVWFMQLTKLSFNLQVTRLL